ncbi:hypothetical protein Pint_36373 [Pistacia integerrima]|uniref:Uncharacterized protein n=1 Tax=Pistacia integerrima TaxID=434235 RepID=A0ACC0XYL3_9ROSI|nr:hypothetical protein Pint_36373 [Pistacia integerrima]
MKEKNTSSVLRRILVNCAAQAKEYGGCVAAKVPELERDISEERPKPILLFCQYLEEYTSSITLKLQEEKRCHRNIFPFGFLRLKSKEVDGMCA